MTKSASIIQELTAPNAAFGIPSNVLGSAKCIAIVPEMAQTGALAGAYRGDGVATCKLATGGWSAPAPLQLTKGILGFQVSAKSVDLVMLVMNDDGMNSLQKGHLMLSGKENAAAGPMSREGSAQNTQKAAVFIYAKTKGAYGGVAVQAAELSQDSGGTDILYGKDVEGQDVAYGDILNGSVPTTHDPAVGRFLATINRASP